MAGTGVVAGEVSTRTVLLTTNLDSKEGFAVNLASNADRPQVAIAADATKVPYVLIEGYDGSSTNREGTIAVGGFVRVKAGGTVTAGDKLTSNASGKWITTTTDTNNYGGVAFQNGVSDDEILMHIETGMIAG